MAMMPPTIVMAPVPTIVMAPVPTIVMASVPTVVVAATAVLAPPMPMPVSMPAFDLNDCPSALPSIWGVAAGIADADMVGASARAQPVNPIIISRFILVPSFVASAPADYQFHFCNAG